LSAWLASLGRWVNMTLAVMLMGRSPSALSSLALLSSAWPTSLSAGRSGGMAPVLAAWWAVVLCEDEDRDRGLG
jgi:hypothetical protein